MKLPVRVLAVGFFISVSLVVLGMLPNVPLVYTTGNSRTLESAGHITRDDLTRSLNQLADSVQRYMDDFFITYNFTVNTTVSKEEVQRILTRQLIANSNITLDSVRQIDDIITALKEGEITDGEKTAEDDEKAWQDLNLEVARGRLSERYKVVADERIDESQLSDLKYMLEDAQRRRVAPKMLDIDPLLIHEAKNQSLPAWKRFQNAITQYQLYSESSSLVDELLKDLRTQKIRKAYNLDGGTEIKLTLTLLDNNRVVFKPMRFPRDWDAWPDHYYFHDFERHVSEIAVFHLDRVFGFRRIPPVTGRFVNVTSEIENNSDDKEVTKTFFTSMAGNRCFYTKCDYYCDIQHAVCGRPHLLEGSLMSWLPSQNYIKREEIENPWRRSYSKKDRAAWEDDPDYCYKVKDIEMYKTGRRLLDLLDLTILDFLTGNMDRHHYYTFWERYGNDTFIVTYDSGRGFGRAKHDELSILTPLIQCCVVRMSTFEKLMAFETGSEHLSVKMNRSMASDPVSPVLTDDHLQALDRRVRIVLKEVHRCAQRVNTSEIIIDDGF